MPPQEGGVNYKEQYELIQISNLLLMDEIKRIDAENKLIKTKVDVTSQTSSFLVRPRLRLLSKKISIPELVLPDAAPLLVILVSLDFFI